MKKSDLESFVRKGLVAGKLVLGSREVQRDLQGSSLAKVVASSNAEKAALERIGRLCSVSGVEFLHSALSNTQLGILCKRQHTVSFIGFKK